MMLDLLSFFKSMIDTEEEIVRSVEKSIEDIQNFAVRSALKGISYDSLKHAEMYRSATELLSEPRSTLDERTLDKQRNIVKKHISMEEKIIARLEEMIPQVENKKVSFILNAITEDEKRHHMVLKKVEELILRGETVTDEDWWDALWGDSPGLWT